MRSVSLHELAGLDANQRVVGVMLLAQKDSGSHWSPPAQAHAVGYLDQAGIDLVCSGMPASCNSMKKLSGPMIEA
jgi:hypothetical protein